MKTIKRYKNRKLYDLETHLYVGLPKIVEFVDSGIDFRVVACDNKDITNEVLLKAMSKHSENFKYEVLRDLLFFRGKGNAKISVC
jgi:polyhydroxyalkanoate synthesis regulator protein